ncbi:hypothetical protein [Nocardioides gilvus]|uniref:hypothetical protein n=1 Tax=Nocardioides gilvus TaxID=1735589 RepID=UPI000D74930E|nr:hypothetical protein [Nocardioides gilvus]
MDRETTPASGPDRRDSHAVTERDFAQQLRTALVARHATLRGLSVALTERGHPVSTPLLAAWRSGAVVPGGAEDLACVTVLEQLLDLAPGDLGDELDPDATGSHRSRRPGTFDGVLPTPATGAPAHAAEPDTRRVSDSVRRARTALGFDRAGQLMTETRVEVVLELDEQGAARRITQRTQWVSPAGGVDAFPVVLVTATPVTGRGRVEPVEGCRLGPSYVDLAEGVFATSLVLPAPLREGGTASTVHRTHLPSDVAPDDFYEHWVHHEVEEVSVEVVFAAGSTPRDLRGLVRVDEVEQACDITQDDRLVRVVRHRFGPGGVGLRWSW